jgi:integrase
MSAQPQREKLTKRRVDAAKAQAARYDLWDGALPGFALRVAPDGTKSFILRYRLRGQGRQSPKRFMSLGRYGAVTVDQARAAAQSILGEVAKGLDPAIAQRKAETTARNTLAAVCEEYLKRDGKALRTVEQRRALLKRLVLPALGARPIDQIKRGDIVALLDRIEDESGPRMADMTLAVLRKIMNWHETRNEDFRSPIVRGMARTKPKERARQNTLNDDELRAIWKAASEAEGPFPALLKFLLLTAARRTEAAAMTRAEISGGDWELPAARNKTKLDLIRPLSAAAQEVLASLPQIGNRYVFTTDGRSPLSGFSKAKREFEKRCGVTGWRLHDLRRTARTLMSRAGVNSDHAERALGHVINGVRATYDRHEFYQEKKTAFEALAAQIADILKSKRAGR